MFNNRQTSLPIQNAEPIDRDLMRARGYPVSDELKPTSFVKKAAALAKGIFRAQSSEMRTYSITIPNTVTPFVGKNVRRSYLMLQNIGTVDMWIAFGATPAIGSAAIKLPPNGVWIFEAGIVPINEGSAITSTGAALAITEGVYV